MIMPSLDMIGVVNRWNLFGRVPRPVLLPTLNAMIDAAARLSRS